MMILSLSVSLSLSLSLPFFRFLERDVVFTVWVLRCGRIIVGVATLRVRARERRGNGREEKPGEEEDNE